MEFSHLYFYSDQSSIRNSREATIWGLTNKNQVEPILLKFGVAYKNLLFSTYLHLGSIPSWRQTLRREYSLKFFHRTQGNRTLGSTRSRRPNWQPYFLWRTHRWRSRIWNRDYWMYISTHFLELYNYNRHSGCNTAYKLNAQLINVVKAFNVYYGITGYGVSKTRDTK